MTADIKEYIEIGSDTFKTIKIGSEAIKSLKSLFITTNTNSLSEKDILKKVEEIILSQQSFSNQHTQNEKIRHELFKHLMQEKCINNGKCNILVILDHLFTHKVDNKTFIQRHSDSLLSTEEQDVNIIDDSFQELFYDFIDTDFLNCLKKGGLFDGIKYENIKYKKLFISALKELSDTPYIECIGDGYAQRQAFKEHTHEMVQHFM